MHGIAIFRSNIHASSKSTLSYSRHTADLAFPKDQISMDDSIFSMFGLWPTSPREVLQTTDTQWIHRDAATASPAAANTNNDVDSAPFTPSALGSERLRASVYVGTERTTQGPSTLQTLTDKHGIETREKQHSPCVHNDGGEDDKTEERNRLRRERNRIAATRSRGRKKERVDQLVKEIKKLEDDNFKLRKDLRKLEQEKQRLSLTLQIHEMKCSIRASSKVNRAGNGDVDQTKYSVRS
ncbi:fos-related antigen 2-like [Ptychodera flava]|uniref:fos-related antigen 2-like n=1 Tax=Ptychodera flava TaxID=63121 RepID=UPI00396A5896